MLGWRRRRTGQVGTMHKAMAPAGLDPVEIVGMYDLGRDYIANRGAVRFTMPLKWPMRFCPSAMGVPAAVETRWFHRGPLRERLPKTSRIVAVTMTT